MSSAEDLRRTADSTAASLRVNAENEANKIATAAQIVILQQIIRALPPPLNAAATLLGEGTFAALSISLKGVKNPSPDGSNNPIKLIALAIAFAIIKAIWCFIKSLLNPLPIVGSFFPLCSNDEQLQQGTNEAQESAQDPDNQALNAQTARFNSVIRENQPSGEQQPLTETQPQQTTENETGTGEGITFDQFVARTANASGVSATRQDITNELLSITSQASNNGQTSANIPAQPATEPEWQPGDRSSSTEPLSYQEYRKLFGL